MNIKDPVNIIVIMFLLALIIFVGLILHLDSTIKNLENQLDECLYQPVAQGKERFIFIPFM